ncbi:1,4-dihydroxy-2-naphthoyl-CoA synthase [Varibaculum timonense]|uniref:1,4-dihydroxy-2-naphthoyl-CoA synthase n=1 Tax=Varibaculum timonense TaxID=1964383 RepID=UPI0022E20B7F|nr:1,4-dihydroxy-2-naphthoyl-CoA synthase [Varibaculum timonense]
MSQLANISDTFDAQRWIPVPGFENLTDLTFHRAVVKSRGMNGLAAAEDAPVSTPAPSSSISTSPSPSTSFPTPSSPSPSPSSLSPSLPGETTSHPVKSSRNPKPYKPGRERYQLTNLEATELADCGENGAKLPVLRIAFDRPQVRNAFRPHTVDELLACLEYARSAADVAAVILTGNGPSDSDGGYSFCSGGDQRIRDRGGYRYEQAGADPDAEVSQRRQNLDLARTGRLHILEVQRIIRAMPKPVIAAVPGWAAGGGHSLVVVCDLALASQEYARFKQTDANVGSFDAGYGSALLARQVGDKRARQIFYLANTYDARQAEEWGVINAAVPHQELEAVALEWALTVARKSPQAIRMLKYAFNLADDGLLGQQLFAGEATRLAYGTDEAEEGRTAFLEHREPDWSAFPYYY